MNNAATDDMEHPEADQTAEAEAGVKAENSAGADAAEEVKLTLDVQVSQPSDCERHVTVSVSRDDIDRYFEKEFDELVPKAEVPGFRAGRAPRKLVVNRFREQVGDSVKGKLLVDCLAQVNESQGYAAISEPDLDLDAVVLPDEGPMTFEFTLEVRPDFELPEWKGLTLEKPEFQVTEEDITRQLDRVLSRYTRLVPRQGPAEMGDHLTLDIRFTDEGNVLSTVEQATLRLRPKLSLRDAEIESFGSLMLGVQPGEIRDTPLSLSGDVENEALRGKLIRAEFSVTEVDAPQKPALTEAFLHEIGGFETVEELRGFLRVELERQLDFRQQQHLRKQITGQLTRSADWQLPPKLLRNQARRELTRIVLELQSASFTDEMIQKYSNQLQRNSLEHTSQALKEHFILERIAEEEKIDAEPDDYDVEIARIAAQSNTPPRRVKARLEKRGEMDSLRNQIVERKVIDLIISHALVTEKAVERSTDDDEDTVALDHEISGGGDREEIPEARHDQPGPSPTK